MILSISSIKFKFKFKDFPSEIVEIRKGLVKVMKEAKKNGQDTKLVYDKLCINGTRYRPSI